MKIFKRIVPSVCVIILAKSLSAQTYIDNNTNNIIVDLQKEIFFKDNGKLRSFDDNHSILFRRTENILELREYGNIVFSPGAVYGTETSKVIMAPNGSVGIGTATPTGHLSFGLMGDHLTIGNPGFANKVILATGWTGTNGDFTEIRVPGVAANNAFLRVQANGNVGIGTDNPGNYKLAVEGGIAARNVKVTSTAFADYVFEPTYKLRPLSTVESYINENKHLPGMPSAKEVEKDGGFELAAMNVKLLDKIEELTLYVIEIKKENEQMKKDNQQMKKAINDLKRKKN
jgi:hypothetical protein